MGLGFVGFGAQGCAGGNMVLGCLAGTMYDSYWGLRIRMEVAIEKMLRQSADPHASRKICCLRRPLDDMPMMTTTTMMTMMTTTTSPAAAAATAAVMTSISLPAIVLANALSERGACRSGTKLSQAKLEPTCAGHRKLAMCRF